MAVSNTSGDIVATGEFSSIKPAVHIWNSRTLDNVMVLDGIHQKGIHLLAFSSDDKYLITCGLQHPSAVLIYEWTSGAVMVSSRIMTPTQDIVVLYG
jgi:microtubule-associated protein-like 5